MGGIGKEELSALSPPELLVERHDVSVFASGEPVLDDWLRRRARANQPSGASRTYVLTHSEDVVGYCRLAAGAIAVTEVRLSATEHARSGARSAHRAATTRLA